VVQHARRAQAPSQPRPCAAEHEPGAHDHPAGAVGGRAAGSRRSHHGRQLEAAGAQEIAKHPRHRARAVRRRGAQQGSPPEDRDAAIDAAIGLSAEATSAVYAQSIVTQGRRIVPAFVADEKKRIVNTKGIEVHDADPRGLDAVGGLETLKEWLATRRLGFSQEARDFGLPTPKGMLLVGVPGGGKSLTAKAVAAAFSCPLIRFDSGAAQSKWVGESQANIRNVFNVVDAMGKCVLWVDEIEKMFAGATQGAADGGVSSDALGTFLTWMQERTGQSVRHRDE
jgi:hypothetical protein